MTAVQSILLNHKHSYNSNKNYESKWVINQIVFAQRRKPGDNEGDEKEKEQRPRRNIDHITCNDCGEKVHYSGNSDFPT